MRPFNRSTERRLSPVLQQVLAPEFERASGLSFSQITQAVSTLSRLFTTDRASLPDNYLDDPLLAAAYRAYFMPVNLAKIQALLDELPDESGLESDPARPMTILDCGGGPGTGALACMDWIVASGRPGVRVLSVDRSQTAGRDARRLWEVYCRTTGVHSSTLEVFEADLEKPHKGPVWNRVREAAPYDVILMANCLNELFTGSDDPLARRTLLVTEVLPLLHPHGTVMVVEPALRPRPATCIDCATSCSSREPARSTALASMSRLAPRWSARMTGVMRRDHGYHLLQFRPSIRKSDSSRMH